ncbi:zf-HC2 domain-containing protein [Trinickia acidisoli]|uniref:zf-HC2 domain-containing protein n=1 Tax=Trinickia acidisoli TaxID=2767482 RepID=UPI001A8D3A6E|nr:zf-HC2 domain-containing protein [Trinickia acidisoli]
MKNISINDGSERTHLRVWDLLPWIVNGTASDAVRRDVEEHVRECVPCREELVRQRRVHAAMNVAVDVDLPVERGLDRLMQKVQAEERQGARYARAGGAARSRWAWAACGLAAMVLLEAGGLVALGTSPRSPAYRTLSSSDARLPQASIRLVVDSSMTVGKLQALLAPLNLQIVGGPNEDGVYSLGTLGPRHDTEKIVAALRAAPGVRFAEPVDVARSGQ